MNLAAAILAAALPFFDDSFTSNDVVLAVRNSHQEEVARYLSRGADPDTMDADGNTLLMIASREADGPMVQLLLRARAKPNARNLRGETPLMIAAWNRCEPCVELLIERSALIDLPGQWTPLHYAAFKGDARITARLLVAGANPNARSPNGTTPLMMGAMSGVADVARVLIKGGADPKLRNANQDRAEDLAMARKHTDFAAVVRGEEPGSMIDRVIDFLRQKTRDAPVVSPPASAPPSQK